MGRLSSFFSDPRRKTRVVMVCCFILGLLVGWLASHYWLERWTGANL